MISRRTDLAVAAAIFALGAALFASLRPWARPVMLDAATWDSMAVETTRGLVVYRDVFLHKTPGAALLGAVGASVGDTLGFEPVLAAHALFVLLGCLGPVLLYALCRTRLPVGPSAAAAVGMLAYDPWVVAALEGCRPKVATVFFGLASMLAAERGRALSASVFGGASVLFWQPGLAFLLGSWAALVRGGLPKPARLLAWAAASLVPSALLLGWLAAHGALVDFFDQAVLFNLHYIESKARTFHGTLSALGRTFADWSDVEMLLAPAALLGLVAARLRLPRSVVVSGLVYAAMTFVSYQSWPDAILFAPIVGSAVGIGLCALLALRLAPAPAASLACIVLALATLPDTRPKYHPPIDFETQRARFQALAADLSADDVVLGVSVPEFFLHTGRRNGWKWPYLWFGVDDFAAARHPGGFEGILADLDRDPPAMIILARWWSGPPRAAFERWAAERYDVADVRAFPHVQKPMRVFRLRRDAPAPAPKQAPAPASEPQPQ